MRCGFMPGFGPVSESSCHDFPRGAGGFSGGQKAIGAAAQLYPLGGGDVAGVGFLIDACNEGFQPGARLRRGQACLQAGEALKDCSAVHGGAGVVGVGRTECSMRLCRAESGEA